jgi:beta-aspartyl-peptidase (threonine type)
MQRPLLLIHGGAGPRIHEHDGERRQGCAVALEAGWRVLSAGGSAVDAVTSAVAALEDHPLFNAGVGSSLTAAGTVEMDASIMDGFRLTAGAAGAVTTICNPVRLARAILDDGRHVLLVGSGAETFARSRGIATAPPDHFVTRLQRARWKAGGGREGGTVGAVALDVHGHVAAATSTGGLMGKLPGRVGDSAIVGAGTYADDRAGAASATGHGEAIMLAGLAKTAVDLLRDGTHPQRVAARVVGDIPASTASAGVILVDRFGRAGAARNTPSMITGWRTPGACSAGDPE